MRGAPHGSSGYSGGAGRFRTYYYCEGPVRGSCAHRHRTADAAIACLERDRAACRRHGGYSDRWVYRAGSQGISPLHLELVDGEVRRG